MCFNWINFYRGQSYDKMTCLCPCIQPVCSKCNVSINAPIRLNGINIDWGAGKTINNSLSAFNKLRFARVSRTASSAGTTHMVPSEIPNKRLRHCGFEYRTKKVCVKTRAANQPWVVGRVCIKSETHYHYYYYINSTKLSFQMSSAIVV